MRKRYWIFGAFILLAVLQIAVTASRIMKWEDILRTGTQLRLRTRPVDPYDAFRGRYVALDFEEETVPLDLGPSLEWGEDVYALFQEDEDGFARVSKLAEDRPTEGNYLRVKVSYLDSSQKKLNLRFPFQRFYLDEEIAPAAEQAYRTRNSEDKEDAYVTARIKNGYGVLEGLFIDGRPIKEFLSRFLEKARKRERAN